MAGSSAGSSSITTVNKMFLSGVRNFSPEAKDKSKQVIEFFRPLTVIVGQNGCGKTTVIEALKYVTTGIAPPGTGKGREFVHDPRLTEKRDVLARVRLLCTRSGLPLTVTRQMQLKHSERTGKQTFKTLDVAVRFRKFNPNSGEIDDHGISYKTSEADGHVCKLIGAPQAVLGHVILCHQDDSNWPLGDGASLKKKFDEIFEADRYARALEELRAVRKTEKANQQEADVHVATLRERRGHLERYKAERTAAVAAAGAVDRVAASAKGRLVRVQERMDALQSIADAVGDKLQKLDRAQEGVAARRQEAEQLRAGLLLSTGQAAAIQEAIQAKKRALMPQIEAEAQRMLKEDGEQDREDVHTQALRLVYGREYRIMALREQKLPSKQKHFLDDATAANDYIQASRKKEARLSDDLDDLLQQQQTLHAKIRDATAKARAYDEALGSANANIARMEGQVKRYRKAASRVDEVTGLQVLVGRPAQSRSSASSSSALAQASEADAAIMEELGQEIVVEHAALLAAVSSLRERKRQSVEEAEQRAEKDLAVRQAAADQARTALKDLEAHVQRVEDEQAELRQKRQQFLQDQGRIEQQLAQVGGDSMAASLTTKQQELKELVSSSAYRSAVDGVEQLMQTVQDGSKRQARLLQLMERKQKLHESGAELNAASQVALQASNEAVQVLTECTRQATDVLGPDVERLLERATTPADGSGSAFDMHPVEELRHQLEAEIARLTKEIARAERSKAGARATSNESIRLASSAETEADSIRGQVASSLNAAQRYLDKHRLLRGVFESVSSEAKGGAGGVAVAPSARSELDPLPPVWKFSIAPELMLDLLPRATRVLDQKASKAVLSTDMAGEVASVAWDALRSMQSGSGACAACTQAGAGELARRPPRGFVKAIKDQIASISADETEAGEAKAALQELPVLTEVLSRSCKLRSQAGSVVRAARKAKDAVSKAASELTQAEQAYVSSQDSHRAASSCSSDLNRAMDLAVKANQLARDSESKKRAFEALVDRLGANDAASASSGASSVTGFFPQDMKDKSLKDLRSDYGEVKKNISVAQSQLEQAQSNRREFAEREERLRQDLEQLRDKSEQGRKLQLQKQHLADQVAEVVSKLDALRTARADLDLESARSEYKQSMDKLKDAKQVQQDAVYRVRVEYDKVHRGWDLLRREWQQLGNDALPRPRSMSKVRRQERDDNQAKLDDSRQLEQEVTSRISACRAELDELRRMQVVLDKVKHLHDLESAREELEKEVEKLERESEEAQRIAEEAEKGHAPMTGGPSSGAGGDGRHRSDRPEEDERDTDLRAAASTIQHDSAIMEEAASASSGGPMAGEEGDDEDMDETGTERIGSKRRRTAGEIEPARNVHADDEALDAAPQGSDISSRMARLQVRQRGLDRLVASLEGRSREMQRRVRDLDDRLRDYEKVKLAFFRNKTASEIHKLAAGDLDTYHRNLDRALMRFHQQRIAEVNVVIRSLWQQVYRGNDIESIEITSDVSGAGASAAGGARGTRSYNYRVVMRKAGASSSASGGVTDMRGRCSAGQRVLASLVIRMALAQCLASNSGLITLDEPTTNLDSENREALAKAIARLLAARGSQPNLQLVIITHDEDFITALSRELTATGAAGHAPENFYRLSRVAEEAGGRPFSQISRCKWSDLGV